MQIQLRYFHKICIGILVLAGNSVLRASEADLPKGLWEEIRANYQDIKPDQVDVISLADLNGDGKSDAIMQIAGGYAGSCGFTAGIFKKVPAGYKLVSDIACVSKIAVDKKSTNGWVDLLASSREGYFRLSFNGRAYPDSPMAGKREKRTP